MNQDIQDFLKQTGDFIIANAPSAIFAIIILLIGLWVINRGTKMIGKTMTKQGIDETVRNFSMNLLNIILKVILLISVLGSFGVETTSIAAIIAAASFAIGLALQGSLSNFAAGVLLVIFRPYKAGDLVDLGGKVGVVKDIQIFNTIILTPDNRKIFIPNSIVSSNPIINISGQGKIKVEMTFGIGYGDDIYKAKEVIQMVSDRNELILKDPGIEIFVAEWGASSVNFVVRPWCKSEHYWDVYFYMHENLKIEFDKAGLGIPYDTVDVNIVSNKS